MRRLRHCSSSNSSNSSCVNNAYVARSLSTCALVRRVAATWPCAWRTRHATTVTAAAAALCMRARTLHTSCIVLCTPLPHDNTTQPRGKASRFAHRNSDNNATTTTTTSVTLRRNTDSGDDGSSSNSNGSCISNATSSMAAATAVDTRDAATAVVAAARKLRQVHAVLYKNYVTLQKDARVLASFSALAAAALVEGGLLQTLACEGAAQSSTAACRRYAQLADDGDEVATTASHSGSNSDESDDDDMVDVIIDVDVTSSLCSSVANKNSDTSSSGSAAEARRTVRLPRRALRWLRAGIVAPPAPPPLPQSPPSPYTRASSAHGDVTSTQHDTRRSRDARAEWSAVEAAWRRGWRCSRRATGEQHNNNNNKKKTETTSSVVVNEDDARVCVFPAALLHQLPRHFGFAAPHSETTAAVMMRTAAGATRYAAAVVAAAVSQANTRNGYNNSSNGCGGGDGDECDSASLSTTAAVRVADSDGNDDDDDSVAHATRDALRLLRTVEQFKYAKDERLLLQQQQQPLRHDSNSSSRSTVTASRSFVAQLHALRETVRHAAAAVTHDEAALSLHMHTLHAQARQLRAQLPRVDAFVRVVCDEESSSDSNNKNSNSDRCHASPPVRVAYRIHAVDLLYGVLLRYVLAQWPRLRAASDRAAVLQLAVLPWCVHSERNTAALAQWYALLELYTHCGSTAIATTTATTTTVTAADVTFVQCMRALCWPCMSDVQSSIVQRTLHLDEATRNNNNNNCNNSNNSNRHSSDTRLPAWSLTSLVAVLGSSRGRQRLAYELLYAYLHTLLRYTTLTTRPTRHTHAAAMLQSTRQQQQQQQRRRSCELLCLYVLDIDRFVTLRGVVQQQQQPQPAVASSALLQLLPPSRRDGDDTTATDATAAHGVSCVVRAFATQQHAWPYALSRLAFAVVATTSLSRQDGVDGSSDNNDDDVRTTAATTAVREMTLYEAWQSTSEARSRALCSGFVRSLSQLCYTAMLPSSLPTTTTTTTTAAASDVHNAAMVQQQQQQHDGDRQCVQAWQALQPMAACLCYDGGALTRLLLQRELPQALRDVVATHNNTNKSRYRPDDDDSARAGRTTRTACEQLLQLASLAGFLLWLELHAPSLTAAAAAVTRTNASTTTHAGERSDGTTAAQLCALVTRHFAEAVHAMLPRRQQQHGATSARDDSDTDGKHADTASLAAQLLAHAWPTPTTTTTTTTRAAVVADEKMDNVRRDDDDEAAAAQHRQQCTRVLYTHVLTDALRTRLASHDGDGSRSDDDDAVSNRDAAASAGDDNDDEDNNKTADTPSDAVDDVMREWAARLRDEDAHVQSFFVPLTSLHDALWQLVKQRHNNNKSNSKTTTMAATAQAPVLVGADELVVVLRVLCTAHLRSGCNILGKRSSSVFDTMAAVALAVRAPDNNNSNNNSSSSGKTSMMTSAESGGGVGDDDEDVVGTAASVSHARLRRVEVALHAAVRHYGAALPLTALLDAMLIDLLTLDELSLLVQEQQQQQQQAKESDDTQAAHATRWLQTWQTALCIRPHARLVTGMLLMQYGALLLSATTTATRSTTVHATRQAMHAPRVDMCEERMPELQRYAHHLDDGGDSCRAAAPDADTTTTLSPHVQLLCLLLRSLVAAEVQCAVTQVQQQTRQQASQCSGSDNNDVDDTTDKRAMMHTKTNSDNNSSSSDTTTATTTSTTLHEHARRMARVYTFVLYITLVYGNTGNGTVSSSSSSSSGTRTTPWWPLLCLPALHDCATALQTLFALFLQSMHDALAVLTRGGGEEVLWWFAATLSTVQRCWRASTHTSPSPSSPATTTTSTSSTANDDGDGDGDGEVDAACDGRATTAATHGDGSGRMWLTLWDVHSVAHTPPQPSQPLLLLAALPHATTTTTTTTAAARAQRACDSALYAQYCTPEALPALCAWSRHLLACLAPYVQSAQLEQQQQQHRLHAASSSPALHLHAAGGSGSGNNSSKQQAQAQATPHVRVARVRGSLFVLAAVHALDAVGVSTTRALLTGTVVLHQVWQLCGKREQLLQRYAHVLLQMGACMPCSHTVFAQMVIGLVRQRGQLSDAVLEDVLRALCVYVQTCECADAAAAAVSSGSSSHASTVTPHALRSPSVAATAAVAAATDDADAATSTGRQATAADDGEHDTDDKAVDKTSNSSNNDNSNSSNGAKSGSHGSDADDDDELSGAAAAAAGGGAGHAVTARTTSSASWSSDAATSASSSSTLRRLWHDVCTALLDDSDADAVSLSTLTVALHCGALLHCHDTATFAQLTAYLVCGGRAHELSLVQSAMLLRACSALPVTTHTAATDNNHDDDDDDPLVDMVLHRLQVCTQSPLQDTTSSALSLHARCAAFSEWLEALPCVGSRTPPLLWRRARAAVSAWSDAARRAMSSEAAAWWAREWQRSYAYARHCAGLDARDDDDDGNDNDVQQQQKQQQQQQQQPCDDDTVTCTSRGTV